MTQPLSHQLTELLRACGRGDRSARDELLPLVYRDLHRQVQRFMLAQPPGHTLQVTGLVHEAYVRFVGQEGVAWQSRAHFFGGLARRCDRSSWITPVRGVRRSAGAAPRS